MPQFGSSSPSAALSGQRMFERVKLPRAWPWADEFLRLRSDGSQSQQVYRTLYVFGENGARKHALEHFCWAPQPLQFRLFSVAAGLIFDNNAEFVAGVENGGFGEENVRD